MPENTNDRGVVIRPLWQMTAWFLASVLLLQWGWGAARGTTVERLVIDEATVRTAVAIIHALTPEVDVQAVGSLISAPGGGINVLNGCEGTEVLFLLVAALCAYPMSWRWRGVGMLGGTAFVFVLNQARLLALFYSYRSDRVLFNQLHGLVAPLMLIALSLAFMVWMIQLDRRERGLSATLVQA